MSDTSKPLVHPQHIANALEKALRDTKDINYNRGVTSAAIFLAEEIGDIITRIRKSTN